MTLKDQIKETITILPTLDDETLIHYYKCSLNRDASYKPLLRAIEAERKSRNKLKELPDETIENDTRASS
jgi:hypothetical protein